MKPDIEAVIEKPKIPMGNGRLIYVAGPYTGKTNSETTENIWHACRVSVGLWELGYYVFCPHLNTAHFEIYSSLPEEVYLEGDLKFLEKCDCVIMLKGYEGSKGAMAELELARQLNKEIVYE